ncbi:hypothetical protein B2J93_8980 [Marssonina coronariae]|uniref:Uncharacterized protein n=1 Tax=Diplocarpon coronariae TaxID=2795749 RepID=A0A218ZHR9_9HELO|nr:hypothetical protein B2J93_8980 [Marssonina coronariae]
MQDLQRVNGKKIEQQSMPQNVEESRTSKHNPPLIHCPRGSRTSTTSTQTLMIEQLPTLAYSSPPAQLLAPGQSLPRAFEAARRRILATGKGGPKCHMSGRRPLIFNSSSRGTAARWLPSRSVGIIEPEADKQHPPRRPFFSLLPTLSTVLPLSLRWGSALPRPLQS